MLKRNSFAGIVAAGVLSLGGVGAVAVAENGGGPAYESADLDQTAPVDKQAVVDAATPATEDLSKPTGASYMQAFRDSGPTDLISSARSSALSLVNRDRDIMRRVDAIPEDLQTLLAGVWSSDVLDSVVTNTRAAMREAGSDPTYRRYVDHDFQVITAQGTRVDGDQALVLCICRERYQFAGDSGLSDDYPAAQYQLTLKRESGEWRLQKEVSIGLDERTNEDNTNGNPSGPVSKGP